MARILINDCFLENIDLLIFDKDGTLIDVHKYWFSMVDMRARLICERLNLSQNHHLNLMDSMGVDVKMNKIKPEGPVGIKKRETVMEAAVDYLRAIGLSGQEDLCRLVFDEVDIMSVNHFSEIVHPIKGLYNMFRDIRKARCLVALATTDRSDRARLAMSHLNLLNNIDFIAGADMVKNAKPHPEMIDLILRTLGISPLRSAMVGDAVSDVQMGLNAGLRASIGVKSGLTTGAELLRLTPYVVDDVSELKIKP